MHVKEAMLKYGKYTYADYASWDDEDRCELIDGVVYNMSSPSQAHQRMSMEISGQLWTLLKGKTCEVFPAPFDVCLNGLGDKDETVVQPDIIVVCDKSKLDGKKCNGAPDLVIEILSPSTLSLDKVIKYNKYLQTGVKEYWVIDPVEKTVIVHLLENGKFVTSAYGPTGTIPVSVLDDCTISADDLFGE